MNSTAKRLAVLGALGTTLGVVAPVTGASALASPTAAAPPSPPPPPAIAFVPPRVGQLSVDIGPTIINGKVIDPGLHVLSPGVSVPPIDWTPSSTRRTPRG